MIPKKQDNKQVMKVNAPPMKLIKFSSLMMNPIDHIAEEQEVRAKEREILL